MRRKVGLVLLVSVLFPGCLFLIQNTRTQAPDSTAEPQAQQDDSERSAAQNRSIGPTEQESDETAITRFVNSSTERVQHTTPQQPKIEHKPEEKTVVIDNTRYPLRRYEPMLIPNDTYANQWWVSDARTDQMWDVAAGESQTTMAIIDSGFALEHEEFANRWHINSAESGAVTDENPSQLNCTDQAIPLDASCNLIDDDFDGIIDNESGAVVYENPSQLNCTDQAIPLDASCNLIDDDNNGYIDDVTGWDFINNDNSPQAGELNPEGAGVTHGTLVAGVAAATGNNSRGIAGVDWQTKILPIQALDDDSYGDTLSVGRAIYYAIEQNADVINISLGTEFPDSYVRGAIEAATRAGIVVVASSGNDGCDCIVYPARYPEVIAVGALNTSNLPASFSSYGSTLDILAPGTSMISPTFTAANQTSAYSSGVAGTSFASPFTAGLITRLLSHQPDLTPLQIVALLTESTNRMTLGSNVVRTNQLGFGKVDAKASTDRATIPRSFVQIYALTRISAGAQFEPDAPTEMTGTYQVYDCARPTTPIYELQQSTQRFFTISHVELRNALRRGFASTFFAYGCLHLPHDTADTIRAIDVFREFRNIATKLP